MAAIAISAPNQLAAQAGAALAAAGGNAADAAVAAAMVAATTEPGMTSLGGAAYATIRLPGGSRVLTIDGGAAVPGLGLGGALVTAPDLHPLDLTYGGRRLRGYCGWASAATPGCIAALYRAHDSFGALQWRDVVGPAIETARVGFPLSPSAAVYLQAAATTVFARDSETAAVVLDANGAAVKAGTTLRIPHLDEFLVRLANGGPEVFYRGSTAARLADAMRANGGLITLADLESYEPVLRSPAAARFGGWSLHTNPVPALGGQRLLSLLGRLEQAWPGRSEAGQLAIVADTMSVLLRSDPAWSGEGIGALESPSTVHVSAVDSAGLACAMTFSSGYGAGVAVPQTGVWLGNSLGEAELNELGPCERLAGNRITSNMAPTVAIHDDGAILAIGTPGADRIVSALAIVLAAVLFDGSSVAEAILRSRIHVGCPDKPDERQTLDTEEGPDVDRALDLTSFVHRAHPRHSMFFGAVTPAIRHHDGRLEALVDPRRSGAAKVV
ncbi:MAG TPA: gamma-glutamyltransferase [Streptosporangiaceae bacterium]|nr:gamma-glutamyltransferase [Streptosporangiaceae bacterium]